MSKHQASRRTIFYAFLLVIAIMLTITSLGLSRIRNLSTDLENVVQEHDVQIALMHTMRHAARERSILLQSMMILHDPFMVDEYATKMGNAAGMYVTARTALLKHKLTGEERELLERQQAQTSATAISQTQAIEFVRNEAYDDASALLINTTLPGQRRAMEMMDEFIAMKRQKNLESLNSTARMLDHTYSLMILLGGAGVLFSIGVAVLTSKRINREIELRRNSESELRNSELRERTIRENIIDGILTLDSRSMILSCNKACKKIFGYESDELLNQSAHLLVSDSFIEEGKADPDQQSPSPEKRTIGVGREAVGKRRDGTTFPVELDISRITMDGETVYIAVIRDITEKKEAEKRLQQFNQELETRVVERTTELARTNEKLRHEINERVKVQHELTHLATHDSLTELPNRTMFKEHLDIMVHAAARHDRNLALFFMDLDGFKSINDNHGHEVGDKLLFEIGRRLRESVRREDVVARMGGDEFTVLLSEIEDVDDVHIVAQKLIDAVNRPVSIGEHLCHVGISIGISLFPRCADNTDKLLRLADDAMYAAKLAGKNTYSFSLPGHLLSGMAV